MSVAVGTSPPWRHYDPHALQREGWRHLAYQEAEAAELAGEAHIARAFRVVAATVETDHVVQPTNGRAGPVAVVMHARRFARVASPAEREALRAEVLGLAARDLTAREVSVASGLPQSTVYAWMRAGRDGPVAPRRRSAKREALHAEMVRLAREGLSSCAIAVRVGIPQSTAY